MKYRIEIVVEDKRTLPQVATIMKIKVKGWAVPEGDIRQFQYIESITVDQIQDTAVVPLPAWNTKLAANETDTAEASQ